MTMIHQRTQMHRVIAENDSLVAHRLAGILQERRARDGSALVRRRQEGENEDEQRQRTNLSLSQSARDLQELIQSALDITAFENEGGPFTEEPLSSLAASEAHADDRTNLGDTTSTATEPTSNDSANSPTDTNESTEQPPTASS